MYSGTYIQSRRRPDSETESSMSEASMRTDTTWRYSLFGPRRLGKGAMLFTGPDGIRDHKVRVEPEHLHIGEGTMSPEGTSEVAYLWRASPHTPYPRPKSRCVGEIGWGLPYFPQLNSSNSYSAPIQLGEFRQAVEDRQTHLYQNAWYPGPNDTVPEDSESSLVMNGNNSNSRPYTCPGRSGRGMTPTATATKAGAPQSHGGRTTSDTGYSSHMSRERSGSRLSVRKESSASSASGYSSERNNKYKY